MAGNIDVSWAISGMHESKVNRIQDLMHNGYSQYDAIAEVTGEDPYKLAEKAQTRFAYNVAKIDALWAKGDIAALQKMGWEAHLADSQGG